MFDIIILRGIYTRIHYAYFIIIIKDENDHRFAFSAIRGEILEIEREREKEIKGKLERKI